MLERSAARTVHIWGGETTVRLPVKPGRGGRNQSLALATAIAMAGRGDEYFLAGGTDGTDGPGEDAGAVVDGGSVSRGLLTGIDAANALQHADAGTFLEATGDLFTTGPTGTNVMDLAIGMKY
jgi:hydroxypyruvate reductase